MFGGLASHAHGFRIFIEALLNGLKNMFVLPPCNAAFQACCTLRFQWAVPARCRPRLCEKSDFSR